MYVAVIIKLYLATQAHVRHVLITVIRWRPKTTSITIRLLTRNGAWFYYLIMQSMRLSFISMCNKCFSGTLHGHIDTHFTSARNFVVKQKYIICLILHLRTRFSQARVFRRFLPLESGHTHYAKENNCVSVSRWTLIKTNCQGDSIKCR